MFHVSRFRNKGFTLVEVLVVSAILLLIVGFLGYLSIKHFWIYNSQVSELDIEHGARTTLDDIDNHVRGAYRVASSYSGYTSGSQTLVLQLPSVDSSNQIISGTYDYVVFYLSSGSLVRQVFPDPSSSRIAAAKTLTDGVDGDTFSFSYDNADYSLVKQVTTTITITKGNPNQKRSITLSSKSSLRNY